ncbi:hypothetical protein [Chelativorans sp. M5D2P16]|uniref:hypothetical protein n=1 Tax=Chelativorans sp. M5D2P16 TaxID=3095678 RepID=UPI002AC9FA5D|nr:hypothetical protein [Chelativorans sp. M5D2P16]MDZ5697134.1 hypothetical protein [Chelativorans sp. M5D2P16]
MSHYTVGAGSRPDLQHYARQADKARSAALKRALGAIVERIRNGRRSRPQAGMAPLQH